MPDRTKYKDLSPTEKAKAKVRSHTNVLIRRGKIERQACRVCGSGKSQVHHEDYAKPDLVDWLCRKCHAKMHGGRIGGRQSLQRMEVSPLMVRPSPSERAVLREKTKLSGLPSMSDTVRAAIVDFAPRRTDVSGERVANVLKEPQPRELTVVFDE